MGAALRSVRHVRVDLDPVGPAPDLFANDFAKGFAIGLVCPLWDTPLRGEIARRVSARRHDRLRGDEKSRAGDDPLLDRTLDTDIGVPRAFGAEIAESREAAKQIGFGMDCRTTNPFGERFL